MGIKSTRSAIYRRFLSVLALLAFSSVSVFADSQFLIEAGRADNSLGQHKDWWVNTGGSFFSSSGNITPPGATPGIGSQFMTSADAACELRPVMTTPGGTWLIEFAIPVTTIIPGTKVAVTLTGCTGLPASVTNFSGGSANAWQTLGTITLDPDVTTPVIGLAWDPSNPTPDSFFNNRIYTCEFRFTPVGDPCENVPGVGPVAGPLAQGQTFVDVPGVTNIATAVTVYADDGFGGPFTQIGQLTSGITNGVNRVTTTPLVKGAQIIATQTVGGQESCQAGAGPKVGGGTSPQIRVNFLINHDASLTGPIGAPGNYNAGPSLHALGSSGPVSGGYLFAPAEGTVVFPSTCWQTVSFWAAADFQYPIFAGTSPAEGSFATLAGLAFSIDDTTDSGPFNIYIDNIVNGSTLIQDFETPAENTADYFFSPPRTSLTTQIYALSAPDVSVISTNNADTGNKSSRVSWQFGTESPGAWIMLLSTGTDGLPQVDLSQPISVRMLVLPVDQTTNLLQVSALGHRNALTNENVTFDVSILRGVEPFSYQWRSNGVDIPDATTSTLTLNNVQLDASANYSVFVTDGSGCNVESFGSLTVSEFVQPPTINFSLSGTELTLDWTGTFNLQSKTNLNDATWSNVGVNTAPYKTQVTNAATFYRLQTP